MYNKDSCFISAVIYVHNNEDVIAETLNTISQTLSDQFSNIELICVDDASSDKTVEIIRKISIDLPVGSISLIQMGNYHGLEKSMSAGVDKAVGDFVFEIDNAIMDYNPELLISVYQRSLQGYDIVSACPEKAPTNSKLFYKLLNSSGNNNYSLSTETLRILTRRAINRIDGTNKNIFYRKIVYTTSGLNTDSIIYQQNNAKRKRHSRNVRHTRMNLAIDTLIVFTNLAYRTSITLSIIMAVFMFIAGIYTVIAYFSGAPIMEGWAPIMGLISAGFTGVFLILTAIIKYFDILIKQTFYQKNYLISTIDELK
ncbi:MAG: glycosyltransferase [Oscillospiraceae bacterium]|nr:glycosyltransferase [Oscillospiraceae bacterium]